MQRNPKCGFILSYTKKYLQLSKVEVPRHVIYYLLTIKDKFRNRN